MMALSTPVYLIRISGVKWTDHTQKRLENFRGYFSKVRAYSIIGGRIFRPYSHIETRAKKAVYH
jgi:hypothetical protein